MRKTDTKPTPKKEKKMTALEQVNAAASVLQRPILAQLADLETRLKALEQEVEQRTHGTKKQRGRGR